MIITLVTKETAKDQAFFFFLNIAVAPKRLLNL